VTRLQQAEALLRECLPHVFRQVNAGRHEQDREDAAELHPRLTAFLQRLSAEKRRRSKGKQ
jgi:hypothetical protein